MSKKNFVAGFLSGLFTYQIQKPEYDDTSGVATHATLNEPVLSTVFEILRWSIHCYGPMMATLQDVCIYIYIYIVQRCRSSNS